MESSFQMMAIQKDLQIKKKGKDWQIVSAMDLGPLVNDLEELSGKRDEMEVAISSTFMQHSMGFIGWWPIMVPTM